MPSQVGRVPAAFDAWFARATARDPAARFQSAKELAEALRAAIDPDGHAGVKPDQSVAVKLSLAQEPAPTESGAPRASISSIPGVRRRPWGFLIAAAVAAIAALSFWALRAEEQSQAHVVTPAPARAGAAPLPPAAAAQGSLSTAAEVGTRAPQLTAAAQIPSGTAPPTDAPPALPPPSAAEAATPDLPSRDATENPAASPSGAAPPPSAAAQRQEPPAAMPAAPSRARQRLVAKPRAESVLPAPSASELPDPEPAKPSARKPDLGF